MNSSVLLQSSCYLHGRTQPKLSIRSHRGQRHERLDRDFLSGLQADVYPACVGGPCTRALHKRWTADAPIAPNFSVPSVIINRYRRHGLCKGNPNLHPCIEFFEATDTYIKISVRGAGRRSPRNNSLHRAR